MILKIKNILCFIVYYMIVMRFLIDELCFPSFIKYIPDVCLAVISVFHFIGRRRKKTPPKMIKINYSVIVFFLYSCLTSLLSGTGILFFAWALRCTFRFYLFFYYCIYYLDMYDIETVFNGLTKLFWVNLAVVLYQFFVQGFMWDYLGGLFGTTQGCNGYMNIFLIVILAYSINSYFKNKKSIIATGGYFVSSLIIAALSEIKFFFFEAVAIVLLALVINKPSVKTVKMAIVSVFSFCLGLLVLKIVFPDSYTLLWHKEQISGYLETSGGIIKRSTAIPYINEHFFDNKLIKQLFGLGFGNCEYSSFFKTPFAMKYDYTEYRYYSYGMQYLETGLVGLVLYAAFFLEIFISEIKLKFKYKFDSWTVCYLATTIPLFMMNIWYNDSCKSEPAYLIYLSLAIVGIQYKSLKINTPYTVTGMSHFKKKQPLVSILFSTKQKIK